MLLNYQYITNLLRMRGQQIARDYIQDTVDQVDFRKVGYTILLQKPWNSTFIINCCQLWPVSYRGFKLVNHDGATYGLHNLVHKTSASLKNEVRFPHQKWPQGELKNNLMIGGTVFQKVYSLEDIQKII